MKVLGIETSCDETGVAVYDSQAGLLGDRLHSQVALHAAHGGVVPELASRDHVSRLAPMVEELLAELALDAGDLDGIAYTAGPGLVGALLVGAAFAEALATAIDRPAIPVHHMEGHLLAPLLEPDPPAFPFVALLVSGGHTMLVEVAALGRYRLLGETLDDAAGEAFDKTARLLGLGYPGGPAVAAEATAGDPGRYPFPRPMTDRPGLDFSFSGLKTHTLRLWERVDRDDARRADIAAGFESAVVETLAIKCRRAIEASGFRRLVVAGGVGANRRLRERLAAEGTKRGFSVHFPRLAWCTDNGAMIALAGALRLTAPRSVGAPGEVIARPRWDLATLAPLAAA